MEHAKFTPGPWFVIHHPGNTWTVQNRKLGVVLCIAQKYGDSSEDNAHLIAAAPDMFDALRNVYGLMDTPIMRRKNADDPFFAEMLDGIRAALSKASGKGE